MGKLFRFVLGLALLWGVYDFGYGSGWSKGYASSEDSLAVANRELQDLGLCEWPKEFAKLHRCP